MIIEARGDVVSLSGSLEKNFWPAIQAAVNLLLRLHPNGILIDASQITNCSDEGARTFLDGMEYISRHHARIVVCHPPPVVLDTLKHMPNLRSQLPVSETCGEGRASLELASDIRRRRRSSGRAPEAGGLRPRLVILPLLGGVGGLRETIGLALQIGTRRRAVGTVPDDDEDEGSELTRRQRAGIPPLLHFISVLEVPRAMPINAPLAEEEQQARAALDEASRIVDGMNITTQSSVARARDVGEEIASQAVNLGAEMIILSLPPPGTPPREQMEPIVDGILQRAACEVIIKNWPA